MPRRRHTHSKRPTRDPRPPTARSAWKRSVSGSVPVTSRPVPSPVRDVVWLEMEPLLKRERARCESISAELHRSTQKLEQFRTRWEPGFSRWYYSQFGEKLTRARDLEAKALELEQLIVRVETEALIRGESERAAYERLERMRAGLDRLDTLRSENIGPEAELPAEVLEMLHSQLDELLGGAHIPPDEYDRLFEKLKTEFRDQLAREREEHLGRSEEEACAQEEARERERAQNRSEKRRAKHAAKATAQGELPFSSPNDPDDARRKQLYRELARKLHPDLNTGLSDHERELWHEVQDAYEASDLEQLEMLTSMIQGSGRGGFAWIKSLSKLKAHFVELQRKLRASDNALREAKKSPAWNFDEAKGKPARPTETSLQIDWELTDAICSLEQEVARFEQRIKRWKKQGR